MWGEDRTRAYIKKRSSSISIAGLSFIPNPLGSKEPQSGSSRDNKPKRGDDGPVVHSTGGLRFFPYDLRLVVNARPDLISKPMISDFDAPLPIPALKLPNRPRLGSM
jgi:hypothetical protein